MSGWYSRPVFFVESVERAIGFYIEKLGFAQNSRYEEGGKALVGEVTREDCEILLNCQQPEKIGQGRMFISVDLDRLRALRAEFESRGAQSSVVPARAHRRADCHRWRRTTGRNRTGDKLPTCSVCTNRCIAAGGDWESRSCIPASAYTKSCGCS